MSQFKGFGPLIDAFNNIFATFVSLKETFGVKNTHAIE